MSNKRKITDEQELILKAVSKLVEPVKVTLGAKGRTVLYNDTEGHDKTLWDGRPYTSKDGYTVAKQVKSENPYEALIMSAIKNASQNTAHNSGDGTTSTMILTEALIETGIDLMTKQNLTSWDVCKLIDIVAKDVLDNIQERYQIPIVKGQENKEELELTLLKRVASVSSNDKEIGEFIHNIYSRIGVTGSIEVQTSDASETKVRMTEGMRTNKGYYNSTFTNNADGSEFKAINPFVVVFDGAIRDYNQLFPFLLMTDRGINGKEPVVVFCDEVSLIALGAIEAYVKTTNHPVCIVQNDQFGDKRTDILNDIAGLTGGYPITIDTDYAKSPEYYRNKDYTELFEYKLMGKAKEVLITNKNTSIIADKSKVDTEYVESSVIYLHEKISNPETRPYDKKHYQRRLANLTGGIALIKVGGATEIEMKELFFRYEDAVLAVRSAINKGVCIGGGYTWTNCYVDLENSLDVDKSKFDNSSYNAILSTLLSIPKQLLINAGLTSNSEFKTYVTNITQEKCLDLITDDYVSVEEFEIYDSCATLQDVVNNATSVAKTMISVAKIIANNIVYEK